jgi:hypothetical protein
MLQESVMSTMGSIKVDSSGDVSSDQPVPEASWDLYDMIQAFLQVNKLFL